MTNALHTLSSSEETAKERIIWLDSLKGVGILLVVIFHTLSATPFGTYLTACYMPLFFIASGYIFYKKGRKNWQLKRLLVPYTIWIIFYLCLVYAFLLLNNAFTWKQCLTYAGGAIRSRFSLFPIDTTPNIVLLPPGARPLWFLTCMVLSSLLSLPLIRTQQSKLRLLLAIGYIILSVALAYLPILLPWSLDTAFMGALFIWSGYMAAQWNLSHKSQLALFVCALALYILLVYVNGEINMSVRIYGDFAAWSIPLFLSIGILGTYCYAFVCNLLNSNFIGRSLAYLGQASLTIMCVHSLFIILFDDIFNLTQCLNFLPYAIQMFCLISAVVLASCGINQVLNSLKPLKKHS